MLGPENYNIQPKKYEPVEMRECFTEIEVSKATKSLKNGKSAGIDNINAEYIKYAPPPVHNQIAKILNEVARTGNYPEEMDTGILIPLPKPGCKVTKTNLQLRPIILLSILRKITTICLIRRIWERLSPCIPKDQAAYQAGRSTNKYMQLNY